MLLNATDAKKLTNETLRNKYESDIKAITNRINEAVSLGAYITTYRTTDLDTASYLETYLREYGYTTTYRSIEDKTAYNVVIGWA